MAAGISAIGRENRQSIVIIDMAQSAGHAGVGIGQQEAGGAVIEDSRRPSGNRMASGAGRSRGWGSRSDGVRDRPANRRGAHKGRLVAPVTIRRSQAVVVINMAEAQGRSE